MGLVDSLQHKILLGHHKSKVRLLVVQNSQSRPMGMVHIPSRIELEHRSRNIGRMGMVLIQHSIRWLSHHNSRAHQLVLRSNRANQLGLVRND